MQAREDVGPGGCFGPGQIGRGAYLTKDSIAKHGKKIFKIAKAGSFDNVARFELNEFGTLHVETAAFFGQEKVLPEALMDDLAANMNEHSRGAILSVLRKAAQRRQRLREGIFDARFLNHKIFIERRKDLDGNQFPQGG